MKGDPQLIDTRSATVELVSPELIEVRFKPEVKLDVQGLGEIVHAKNHLGQGLNPDVLAVAPPELDFELNVLHMDHAVGHGVKCNSNRLAFAAQSEMNERLASIYFSYHPRKEETAVFLQEKDARAWLVAKVKERTLS
ncbi:MAG: hypothetical protein KA175_03960 [Flavobacteriales bacterium]|nr:hypothetical protein [Flavobacteriales bacterium]MBP6696748.1 hypothetical protein [Flavobacteriales bacterium]